MCPTTATSTQFMSSIKTFFSQTVFLKSAGIYQRWLQLPKSTKTGNDCVDTIIIIIAIIITIMTEPYLLYDWLQRPVSLNEKNRNVEHLVSAPSLAMPNYSGRALKRVNYETTLNEVQLSPVDFIGAWLLIVVASMLEGGGVTHALCHRLRDSGERKFNHWLHWRGRAKRQNRNNEVVVSWCLSRKTTHVNDWGRNDWRYFTKPCASWANTLYSLAEVSIDLRLPGLCTSLPFLYAHLIVEYCRRWRAASRKVFPVEKHILLRYTSRGSCPVRVVRIRFGGTTTLDSQHKPRERRLSIDQSSRVAAGRHHHV